MNDKKLLVGIAAILWYIKFYDNVTFYRVSFMPELYDYTDYRKFLHDWYNEEKERDSIFTYRYIAEQVGFKSAGQFTKILRGQANMSVDLARRFSDFMGLGKRRSAFFLSLVLFNQAKNHEDKSTYFKEMKSFSESRIKVVEAKQYEFYHKWYYTVVRELLSFYPLMDTDESYKGLASLILPAITATEVKRAVQKLLKLKLVKKTADGYFKQSDSLIKADSEVTSMAINNFVLNSLELAKRAVDGIPKSERVLSATTVTVSERTFKKIHHELRQFREKIMHLAREDDVPERAYQFNFQVFPVSKKQDTGNDE